MGNQSKLIECKMIKEISSNLVLESDAVSSRSSDTLSACARSASCCRFQDISVQLTIFEGLCIKINECFHQLDDPQTSVKPMINKGRRCLELSRSTNLWAVSRVSSSCERGLTIP